MDNIVVPCFCLTHSGRQPNFAALNRGRHLYLAGRPSRWALARISSCVCIACMRRLVTWWGGPGGTEAYL